jgi:hypothetical protein
MPRRSWTAGLAGVLGVVSAGAAVALTVHPGAAGAEPNPSCDKTTVVVEWHDAQNAPTKGLSAKCADPGSNPFDALKNADLSPITQVESAVGTILCAILNVPATSCDQLPANSAWTYWYVDPNTHQWQGPYTSPPGTSASDPSPSSGSGGPGAGTGPQPTPAPPVEDWVYQSDYPDHTVKPAYYVQGAPPTSAPSTTASSGPQPSTGPAPSGTAVPSIPTESRGIAPSLPAGVPHSHHSRAAHRSPAKSAAPSAHSSAATTTSIDRADGFDPPQLTEPRLPDVSPPDQWWIAADRSGTTMTREGQASKTAWATAAPSNSSAHRLAWSTGLGSAAVVLLGIGITAQLRRRRSG